MSSSYPGLYLTNIFSASPHSCISSPKSQTIWTSLLLRPTPIFSDPSYSNILWPVILLHPILRHTTIHSCPSYSYILSSVLRLHQLLRPTHSSSSTFHSYILCLVLLLYPLFRVTPAPPYSSSSTASYYCRMGYRYTLLSSATGSADKDRFSIFSVVSTVSESPFPPIG